MGRIILGLLASLQVVSSLPAILLAFLVWAALAEGADVSAGRADCSSLDAAELFFPMSVLGERLPHFDEDAFRREWYTKHLRAMAEPSLSCGESPSESYRFLWLRTFGRPIAVRIETGRSNTLTAVELDGAGGYQPGEISRRVQRQLSADEWKTLSDALKATDFWNMPGRGGDQGLDGEEWIMEGRSGHNYHVVDRWLPAAGSYRELCLMLVKLSGLMPSGETKRDAVY
jgi:hypothetical protein